MKNMSDLKRPPKMIATKRMRGTEKKNPANMKLKKNTSTANTNVTTLTKKNTIERIKNTTITGLVNPIKLKRTAATDQDHEIDDVRFFRPRGYLWEGEGGV